jgi:hypothetical protein
MLKVHKEIENNKTLKDFLFNYYEKDEIMYIHVFSIIKTIQEEEAHERYMKFKREYSCPFEQEEEGENNNEQDR